VLRDAAEGSDDRQTIQRNHLITAVNNENAHGKRKEAYEEKRHGLLSGVRGNLRFLHSFGDLKAVCQRCGQRFLQRRC